MLNSDYRKLTGIILPFAMRQMYMHTFDLANPIMAKGVEDYLEPVKLLIASAGANKGIAHMTVDEKIIKAGMSQRRPRPHVDGCFYPAATAGGKWGHGGWLHACNNIDNGEYKRMSVIVAASVEGCRAWKGTFDGEPKNDGDLSHLTLSKGEVLPANIGFLLSPDCVHESMIQKEDTKRTFLRIALPTDYKY